MCDSFFETGVYSNPKKPRGRLADCIHYKLFNWLVKKFQTFVIF